MNLNVWTGFGRFITGTWNTARMEEEASRLTLIHPVGRIDDDSPTGRGGFAESRPGLGVPVVRVGQDLRLGCLL